MADITSLAKYRLQRAERGDAPSKIEVMFDKNGNVYAGCYSPGPNMPDNWQPWQMQLNIADARELGIRLLHAVEDAERGLKRG